MFIGSIGQNVKVWSMQNFEYMRCRLPRFKYKLVLKFDVCMYVNALPTIHGHYVPLNIDYWFAFELPKHFFIGITILSGVSATYAIPQSNWVCWWFYSLWLWAQKSWILAFIVLSSTYIYLLITIFKPSYLMCVLRGHVQNV